MLNIRHDYKIILLKKRLDYKHMNIQQEKWIYIYTRSTCIIRHCLDICIMAPLTDIIMLYVALVSNVAHGPFCFVFLQFFLITDIGLQIPHKQIHIKFVIINAN